jgi:hypothetical protein
MSLEIAFDNLLLAFDKGLTIEQHRRGVRYVELEKVKEWKSKFGYEFHIYGGEHFIEGKPHFHLIKKSDGFEGKYFFNGDVHIVKKGKEPPKQIIQALKYFLEKNTVQQKLETMWNDKNPTLKTP